MASAKHLKKRAKHYIFKAKKTLWQIIIMFIADLLLTAGLIALMFYGWIFFVNDENIVLSQQKIALDLSESFKTGELETSGICTVDQANNVIVNPQNDDYFAVIYIERLGGETWKMPIARGVDKDVINVKGYGWYFNSQLPGEAGNFAIAGHRSGYGSSLRYAGSLKLGDYLIIETCAGWYVYEYRNTEYVFETDIQVTYPIPQVSKSPSDFLGGATNYDSEEGLQENLEPAHLMTLTTCNPYPLSSGERMIIYSELKSFTPRSEGKPQELHYNS